VQPAVRRHRVGRASPGQQQRERRVVGDDLDLGLLDLLSVLRSHSLCTVGTWVGATVGRGGGRLDLFRVLLVVKLDAVELVARRFERNKRLLRRPDLDRRLGRQVQAARGLERGELVRPRVVRRLSPVVREDYLHLRAEGRDVSS